MSQDDDDSKDRKSSPPPVAQFDVDSLGKFLTITRIAQNNKFEVSIHTYPLKDSIRWVAFLFDSSSTIDQDKPLAQGRGRTCGQAILELHKDLFATKGAKI